MQSQTHGTPAFYRVLLTNARSPIRTARIILANGAAAARDARAGGRCRQPLASPLPLRRRSIHSGVRIRDDTPCGDVFFNGPSLDHDESSLGPIVAPLNDPLGRADT